MKQAAKENANQGQKAHAMRYDQFYANNTNRSNASRISEEPSLLEQTGKSQHSGASKSSISNM